MASFLQTSLECASIALEKKEQSISIPVRDFHFNSSMQERMHQFWLWSHRKIIMAFVFFEITEKHSDI